MLQKIFIKYFSGMSLPTLMLIGSVVFPMVLAVYIAATIAAINIIWVMISGSAFLSAELTVYGALLLMLQGIVELVPTWAKLVPAISSYIQGLRVWWNNR